MRYYKLFNQFENHCGFQYHDGLNVDTNEFNPTGTCSKGGLYFFNEVQLLNYDMYTDNVYFIRQVTIPTDAQVYHEYGKSKADKLFLHEKELFDYNNLEKYIDFSNEEICKLAVQQTGYALQYVENQTPELCKLAVQQDGYALRHVENQTPEICKLAVQQDGLALYYVKNQTPEICKLAVQQNRDALEYVKKSHSTKRIRLKSCRKSNTRSLKTFS